MSNELVVGLLHDAILPHARATFSAPALDDATRAALSKLVGSEVLVLTITSPIELPSLAKNRWATRCRVVDATEQQLTLEGLARQRLLSATGLTAPYKAVVEPPVTEPAALEAALASAAKLVEALRAGARAEPGAAAERALLDALTSLGRAALPPEARATLLEQPLDKALEQASEALARNARGVTAASTLEGLVTTWLTARDQSPTLQRQLWSQVVELSRTLDVADPSTAGATDTPTLLQRRLQQANLPPDAKAMAKRELKLLRDMRGDHHEYTMYSQHLEWLARVPWHVVPPPSPSLDAVAAALEASHLGLEAPKRRMLEYLAVMARGGSTRSTVLCLAGPPGVGKTTIAQAIARALARPFAHVALGGVQDDAELRGHRMTYLGSMPGRIITAFANAGSATPVILLDEIDKLGAGRHSTPVGAMLELLDPAQNQGFRDNYLATPYDASHALFICTANELDQISGPLKDRMEIVELDAYQAIEKRRIAKERVLPKVAKDAGLPGTIVLTDEQIDRVITAHTREAGVRQLTRALSALCRSRVVSLVRGAMSEAEACDRPFTTDELVAVLGPPRAGSDVRQLTLPAGVAIGLSVGPDGGAPMAFEVTTWPGAAEVRCTGRMGEVMKESVTIAQSALRRAAGLGEADFARTVHVHAPDGATPKDGPSAGVTVAVALLSAMRGTPVRAEVCFTGELTLTGRVLPVGGVRAKALAAERSGFLVLCLPKANLPEVPAGLRLRVVGVESLTEALAAAFDPQQ